MGLTSFENGLFELNLKPSYNFLTCSFDYFYRNVVVPTPQGCSYRSSGSDHSSSRSCFCPQQQSAFSRVSHPHYSLHQLHLPPTGVPFAPIPVAGAVAFPQVFSAVHASQEGLSGFADDPSDLVRFSFLLNLVHFKFDPV